MGAKAKRTVAGDSPGEYAVLKVGESLAAGATITFVGSAATMSAAMGLIDALADTSASRLAVVQVKRVVRRRPTMSVEPVEEPLGGVA
ncbi:MAG: hypothetical protein ABIZ91_14885 [Gemmatimonadaceae bacterium]